MSNIIVVGHGSFASGISRALELILGKQENYYYIDYNEENNASKYKSELTNLIESLEGEIVICSDLLNGTPFNVAMEISVNNENIKLIYGINLASLMELISQKMFTDEEIDLNSVINRGKENIGIFTIEQLNAIPEDIDKDTL